MRNQFAGVGDFSHILGVKIADHSVRFAPWRLLVAALACLAFCAPSHAADGRGRQFPELRLKDGTVLHDVTIIAVGSTTLMAKWAGGRGSIQLKMLPDNLRAEIAPPVAAAAPAPATAPGTSFLDFDPKLASAELPTEIKLTNGFVMHKSTVTRWEANGVTVSYQGGIVLVRYSNIAPEQRAIFEARKDEAIARQAKEDARSSVGQDTAAREQQAREAAAAQAQDEADRKAEEIRNGISFHYLVKGMTKEQAKLAFGTPGTDNGDTLLYPSRGHDKYGNSADRLLIFTAGLLTGWRDQRENDVEGGVDH